MCLNERAGADQPEFELHGLGKKIGWVGEGEGEGTQLLRKENETSQAIVVLFLLALQKIINIHV